MRCYSLDTDLHCTNAKFPDFDHDTVATISGGVGGFMTGDTMGGGVYPVLTSNLYSVSHPAALLSGTNSFIDCHWIKFLIMHIDIKFQNIWIIILQLYRTT